MKHSKTIGLMAVLLAAVLAAGAGCSKEDESGIKKATAFPDSVLNDEYLVWVNSHPIRGKNLRAFTLMYDAGTPDSLLDAGFNERMLEGLIDRTLLWLEAKSLGITVDDSTSQWFIQEFTRSVGGSAALDRLFGAAGMSLYDLEELIKQDLMVRKFIEGNIGRGIQVSDSIALAYYNENIQEFSSGDSVRARHIILRIYPSDTQDVKDEKIQKLRALRERIVAGEDFAALAREFSEGPSAADGGDLGYFSRRDMVAAFSDAAFALAPGDISDVVETVFGYHLIYVEDKKLSRTLDYEEVRNQLIAQIQGFLLGQQIQNHLQRSKSVAIIQRNY